MTNYKIACEIRGEPMIISKAEFIPILAKFIEREGHSVARKYGDTVSEPYRAGGDRLVDEALDLVP
jgi:hypothetical protein